jgi:hypothetical protein
MARHSARHRPTMSDLGWHSLTKCLLLLQLGLLSLGLIGGQVFGLRLDTEDALLPLGVQMAAAAIVWAYYTLEPGWPSEWITAEAAGAFLLLLTLAALLAPLQYVAVAVGLPVVDPTLARIDAVFGIDVGALAEWTRNHPRINGLLTRAYYTLVGQFLLIVPVLWWRGDRVRLWEYAFNFHVCASTTTLCAAVLPVACPFTYLNFQPTLPQRLFSMHFAAVRDGTLTVIPLDHMQGMVSMPSFHTAGALIVTWALRGSWLVFPVSALNLLLIAATFMSGTHYVIDVLAGALLSAISVAAWRAWGARRIAPVAGERVAAPPAA